MPSQERLRLETERLLLRPPVVEDASAATELLTDPEVMRFIGGEIVPAKKAAGVVGKWIERWAFSRTRRDPYLGHANLDARGFF